MRCLLTTHQFLPEFSTGTELITYYLAKELRQRGHEVTIATGYPAGHGGVSEEAVAYAYDGLPVRRFHHRFETGAGQRNAFESEYNHRQAYQWFQALLREVKPELVHFVHLSRFTASIIDACREAGVPALFTATDFWAICPTIQLRLPDGSMCRGPSAGAQNCIRHLVEGLGSEKIARHIRRMPAWMVSLGLALLRWRLLSERLAWSYVRAVRERQPFIHSRFGYLARLIVPSHTMRELLVANGFDAARIIHLPYGIPTEHIERARGAETRPGPLRVAFIGQIHDHKGCHVLAEAFRRLPAELPIRLRFHGDLTQWPEYTQRLRDLTHHDPRVALAGRFEHKDVGAVLRQSDLVVCPSIWYENTPLVIYEAMAAGVPVVASDLPGMAEVIKPNVNGLLFPMGDAPALARILRALAENPDRVARMAAATEPPLSVGGHVTRIEEIYRQILAQPPSAPVSPLDRITT